MPQPALRTWYTAGGTTDSWGCNAWGPAAMTTRQTCRNLSWHPLLGHWCKEALVTLGTSLGRFPPSSFQGRQEWLAGGLGLGGFPAPRWSVCSQQPTPLPAAQMCYAPQVGQGVLSRRGCGCIHGWASGRQGEGKCQSPNTQHGSMCTCPQEGRLQGQSTSAVGGLGVGWARGQQEL